jgi:hypothetical protein
VKPQKTPMARPPATAWGASRRSRKRVQHSTRNFFGFQRSLTINQFDPTRAGGLKITNGIGEHLPMLSLRWEQKSHRMSYPARLLRCIYEHHFKTPKPSRPHV